MTNVTATANRAPTRGIVTPTFSGHFSYIETYLESFDRYATDKKVPIYFTVEASDVEALEKIAAPHRASLQIKIFSFESILAHFGISATPTELLREYGKFTYQTFKKFYTLLYIGIDQALVLDSESMLIKPTNVNGLFDAYFAKPFIVRSDFAKRDTVPDLIKESTNNACIILGQTPTTWALETFHWFYDLKILKDMFEQHGLPMDWAQKLKAENMKVERPIFEIIVFYLFLLKHSERYCYQVVNAEVELEKHLGAEEYSKYITRFRNDPPFCFAGVVEHFLIYLTHSNRQGFANYANALGYTIARCDLPRRNYQDQLWLLKHTHICMLAASQDSAHGLNKSLRFYLRPNLEKIKFRLKQIRDLSLAPLYLAKNVLALLKNSVGYCLATWTDGRSK